MTTASDTALIVFAKAPVAGQAKTRLIPALGADGAAALAARLLRHTLAQGAAAGFGALELCVTPDAGPEATHPALRAAAQRHGAVLTQQGDGDLGARMQRALSRRLAAHAQVLLIGTDAPALDAAALRDAAAALATQDAVFVPALDGGYALVGLARQPVAPARLFEAMPWSTPRLMALTRARLAELGLRSAELAPRPDIDEPADLVHLPPHWPEAGRARA